MTESMGALARWIAGVLVPMIAPPTAPAGLAWFLHFVLVALTTIGMYFAQPRLGLTTQLGYGPSWLHPFWLALLFLLAYGLIWSASWLWRLLAPHQSESYFPDIDHAWGEICEALARAGIGLGDTPMYLVLGDWNCGAEPIFRTLPGGLAVAGGASAGSPIQAYANRDGIYIAVPGASLLGFRGQLTELTGSDPAAAADSMFQSISVGNKSIGLGGSIAASIAGSVSGGSGPLQEIQKIIKKARDEGRALTDAEKLRVRQLSDAGAGSDPGPAQSRGAEVPLRQAQGPSGSTVLQNPQIAGELAARLVHVCGLMAHSRWPLCPINGAIVAVPMSATNTDVGAQQWGLVAREDLLIADYALKLRFPVYLLVGGVEDLPGAKTFFTKFALDKGNQRLGKGFPLNPDLTAEGRVTAVESVGRWIFGGLLPYWTLRMMRVDQPEDVRANAQLARFLNELDQRTGPMAKLLSRALATEVDRPPLFAGLYLAVLLAENASETKFTRDFFTKIDSTQGYVQWTEEALAEDASYRTLARLGTLATLVIILLVVALAVYVGVKKFG